MKLVDCDPKWVTNYHGKCGDSPDAIRFDCPEGHEDCIHIVPFMPALDGSMVAMDAGRGWQRTGDTFESLTLSPSIRRVQRYPSRAAALADGCHEDHLGDSLVCALHIFIKDGAIEFCGDSK
jgi:hypothetical protein